MEDNVIQPNGAVSGGGSRVLAKTYTIYPSNFGELVSETFRQALIDISDFVSNLKAKKYEVVVTMTKQANYYNLSSPCPSAISYPEYYNSASGNYQTNLYYSTIGPIRRIAIELQEPSYVKKLVVEMPKGEYTTWSTGSGTIIVKFYELT